MKTKEQMIETLNKTDDYRALKFYILCDDGVNMLLARRHGKGAMHIGRWENEDGEFGYDDDVAGWGL